MSKLAEFLAPYIERVEVSAIIGAVVENRLKKGIRLYIGHSSDIEILCEGHTFDMSNYYEVISLDNVSFEYVRYYVGSDSLSDDCYDTILLLEDNGLDDVVLAHYKLKENDLVNLVGYFFI